MEFRQLVFPSPNLDWHWDDYCGQIFWLPIPKLAMSQLNGIFQGLEDLKSCTVNSISTIKSKPSSRSGSLNANGNRNSYRTSRTRIVENHSGILETQEEPHSSKNYSSRLLNSMKSEKDMWNPEKNYQSEPYIRTSIKKQPSVNRPIQKPNRVDIDMIPDENFGDVASNMQKYKKNCDFPGNTQIRLNPSPPQVNDNKNIDLSVFIENGWQDLKMKFTNWFDDSPDDKRVPESGIFGELSVKGTNLPLFPIKGDDDDLLTYDDNSKDVNEKFIENNFVDQNILTIDHRNDLKKKNF